MQVSLSFSNPLSSFMTFNLNVSIHLNILVLLSLPIYHGLSISNLFILKLVKLFGSSTLTSISILLLKLFSHCIGLLSFPILPIALLSGTHQYFPLILKFSKKLNTLVLKCALVKEVVITCLISQHLTFSPFQLITLFLNYVFIKLLTIFFFF